jgi:hypothetical protein
VTYSDPTEAANGASSAKASVDMTSAMSEAAAGLSSSSSNPEGYAPGKGGTTATDTSSIANIDPKLKTLVDGMLASMKAPVVQNAVSKARASKAKVSMAAGPGNPGVVTISGLCSGGTGTFTITGTDSSNVGTYVEYTVDIRFDSCRDVPDTAGIYSITTGTIHVYDKEMAGNTAITRNATLDLIAEKYDSLNSDLHVKTDVVKAAFNATDSGTAISRSGRNTANGSFSEKDWVKNETGTFYFTNMTGDWTWDDVSGVITVANTANGNFGLNFVNASAQTLTLNIGLSNLQNKLRFNADASIDQWVNGSVTITWTPDLSIFGCKSGRITFTTADATPLHYFNNLDTCPDSGTLQINNATIVYFGPDDPSNIVITVGALSVTRPNCLSMEGGICGN